MDRNLPGDIHSLSGLQHIPNDNIGDVLGQQVAENSFGGHGAELNSGEISERPQKGTNGRAFCGNDNRLHSSFT